MPHLKTYCLSILLFSLLACGRLPQPLPEQVFSGETMGTYYVVKVIPGEATAEEAQLDTAIKKALEAVNNRMSTYKTDSELSRLNQHTSTEPFEVSEALMTVLQLAQGISRETDGAFDITVGPLVNVWGFGPDANNGPPDEERLDVIRERVGYEKLILRENVVTKGHPDLYCDLSAIAKGYAVDKVAAALDELGAQRYMIEVGGEVRTRGNNSRGGPWRIGIEKPSDELGSVQLAVPMRDQALATSGNYRNFYVSEGTTYAHTIDPRTGRPVTHTLASVSVVHEDCAHADAYATALMVLGPEKGFKWAEKKKLAAYFIVQDEGGFVTKGTKAFEGILSEQALQQ